METPRSYRDGKKNSPWTQKSIPENLQSLHDQCNALKKEIIAVRSQRDQLQTQVISLGREVKEIKGSLTKMEKEKETTLRKLDQISLRLVRCETGVSQQEEGLLKDHNSGKLFDSHFHINRLQKWGMPWNKINHSKDLVGGMAVFCDPHELPSDELLLSLQSDNLKILVAAGIHPEHASLHPTILRKAIDKIAVLKKQNKLNA